MADVDHPSFAIHSQGRRLALKIICLFFSLQTIFALGLLILSYWLYGSTSFINGENESPIRSFPVEQPLEAAFLFCVISVSAAVASWGSVRQKKWSSILWKLNLAVFSGIAIIWIGSLVAHYSRLPLSPSTITGLLIELIPTLAGLVLVWALAKLVLPGTSSGNSSYE